MTIGSFFLFLIITITILVGMYLLADYLDSVIPLIIGVICIIVTYIIILVINNAKGYTEEIEISSYDVISPYVYIEKKPYNELDEEAYVIDKDDVEIYYHLAPDETPYAVIDFSYTGIELSCRIYTYNEFCDVCENNIIACECESKEQEE